MAAVVWIDGGFFHGSPIVPALGAIRKQVSLAIGEGGEQEMMTKIACSFRMAVIRVGRIPLGHRMNFAPACVKSEQVLR